ncbi:MAG: hypothetical protein IT373_26915 [Polyangiaceae bacterium]|nr:hypothetical protein [Polyangiaceae bacterium]
MTRRAHVGSGSPRRFFGIALALLGAACGQAESDRERGGDTVACQPVAISTLPGVSIHFLASDCAFTLAEAAAGITVDYEVVIESDVPGVVPEPQDAGGCETPGPSGLILHEVLTGGAQQYCLCDVGLCAVNPLPPVTLGAGTSPGAFVWHGENWTGPSDYGAPKGAQFPAGSYELTVSATGTVTTAGGPPQSFDASGRLPLTLTP